MLKRIGTYLLLLLLCQSARAYRDVPVLVHLNYYEQADTSGFNLVESLPKMVYSLIEKDMVTLWASPAQDINISKETLKSLERSSDTKFTNIVDLFINEVWSSNKKKTTFEIAGFSFINKNEKGEKISYGFIDINDIFPYLRDSLIKTNANGSYKTSYWDALMSRNYQFNLVQFGNDDFKKNPLESVKIKNKAFNKKKEIVGIYAIPQVKRVRYAISPDTDNGQQFYTDVNTFLNEDRELFYNYGGYDLYTHLDRKVKFNITKAVIEEVWTKTATGITYEIKSITFFVNDFALMPMDIAELKKYKVFVGSDRLENFLQAKTFDYNFTSINSQEIKEDESPKYKRALENYFWSQVTEYVKYE